MGHGWLANWAMSNFFFKLAIDTLWKNALIWMTFKISTMLCKKGLHTCYNKFLVILSTLHGIRIKISSCFQHLYTGVDFGITWTHRLLTFLASLSPWGISKNGSNIICTSLKIKYFLFCAQMCGTNIKPAMPFWKLNFKWP